MNALTARRVRALGFFTVTAGAVYALKAYHQEAADTHHLWLLRPTTAGVEWLSGVHFERIRGEGYLSRAESFVIAPVCSGVSFFITVFLTGCVGFYRWADGLLSQAARMLSSAVAAFFTTVAVNTVRIVAALKLHRLPSLATALFGSPEDAHRALGMGLYLFALCGLFSLVERWSRRARDGAA